MFTAQQLAYLRVLAGQSANGVLIGFTRTRLLLRLATADDDDLALLLFGWFAGTILLLGVVISALASVWPLVGVTLAGLLALAWGMRRLLRRREAGRQQPPALVFDLPTSSFYVLLPPGAGRPAAGYERYPSQCLTHSRVVVLSSTGYTDDIVVELAFGGPWVPVLRLGNSPLAYEIEQALRWCQVQAAAQTLKSPAS